MSFDIYGGNLRAGHCEVHPYVHEEYPCSLCYAENQAKSDDAMLEQKDCTIGEMGQSMAEMQGQIVKLDDLLYRCVKLIKAAKDDAFDDVANDLFEIHHDLKKEGLLYGTDK